VLEGKKLYLLPVQGSDTQWYRNVLQNPSIRVEARGAAAEFPAKPITEAKAVKAVVEKFREKYGAKDVKKYYSKFDVAVVVGVCAESHFSMFSWKMSNEWARASSPLPQFFWNSVTNQLVGSLNLRFAR